MQEECFVKIDGTMIGPITRSGLKQLIIEGRLTGESLVRQGQHGKWVRASRIRGFHAESAKLKDAAPEEQHGSAAAKPKRAQRGFDIVPKEREETPILSARESTKPRTVCPSRRTLLIRGSLVGFFVLLSAAIAINRFFNAVDVNGPVSASANHEAPQPELGEINSPISPDRSPVKSVNDRTRDEYDLADLIEVSEPAVVRIDTVTRGGSAVGSGFVVSGDGLVVTNHHVIEDAIGAVVRFHNGAISEVKGILYSDENRDIAVIAINNEPLGDLHVLEIAHELPRKGDRVVAFGAPKGLSFSAAEGMVSSVRKGSDIRNELRLATDLEIEHLKGTWIQTTTPLSSGNSGGPLVNSSGEVVGANTFILRDAQNLNFAISATDIRDAIEQARAASLVTLVDVPKTSGSESAYDVVPIDEALSETAKTFLEGLQAERELRLRRIEELEASFEKAQDGLKQAMVDLDVRAQETARRKIRDIARDINELIDRRLDMTITKLDPTNPETGQIGTVHLGRFEVLQVIDKENGLALVTPMNPTGRSQTLFVKGIDLSNIADGDVFTVSPKLVFEVSGTRTYETVVGGTNTVFVLACILNLDSLKEDSLSGRRKSGREKPSLTADERTDIEARKQTLAAEAWEPLKAKLAEGLSDQLRDELKDFSSSFDGVPEAITARNEIDADSKLRRAMRLMEKQTATNGVRMMEEIVRDWPDTYGAAEARKTLAKVKESWESLKTKLAAGISDQLRDELKEFSLKFDGLPEGIVAKNELDAASKLRLAKQLMENRNATGGKQWLREIIEKWPDTHAADEAKKALRIDK
ncbi:MAG: trypsin-like peptidase domain-containing protein [Pseudorhodoplanes sp.]